jgi:hypothetical protein
LKAPRKEYSIGQRRECDEKTGAAKFKQNSRDLRLGHRLKLFNLMLEMYLDKLAMAGGEGSDCSSELNTRLFANIARKMVGMIDAANCLVEFTRLKN